MNVDRYSNIVKLPKEFDAIRVTTFVPKPSKVDYKRGYFVRYFVQRANDSTAPIYEVKHQSLNKYKGNPFYKVTSLEWRISGEIDAIKHSNSQSVMIASEEMQNIIYYLPNLIQFRKN